MELLTQAPRGTVDITPNESYKWQFIEEKLREKAAIYGYKELRTPIFEHTELFCRSVGDTTDVVQKEMYTFEDKGGRSITLKPEGTAGAVRAILENGLHNDAFPLKIFYITNCFRYEKPQAGRLREFHQFGAEMFGTAEPSADAELISFLSAIFLQFGIDDLRVEINSIGCPECRKNYHTALREYFKKYESELCETCQDRLTRNPMRILDCKSPVCSKIAADAPIGLDYLCDPCKTHFEAVKSRLDDLNIVYNINPKIVRGLDYYTRTVFEFVSDNIGAQGTVCGGGRYDGLVKELGGPDLPALGFAMGLERLLMIIKNAGLELPAPSTCDIYIANMGETAAKKAAQIAATLRDEGFFAEYDLSGRTLKAQMKYANKINAKYCIVLGDDELSSGKANLKNMSKGGQTEIDIDDIIEAMYETINQSAIEELTSSLERFEL